jgi:hypothetical protein
MLSNGTTGIDGIFRELPSVIRQVLESSPHVRFNCGEQALERRSYVLWDCPLSISELLLQLWQPTSQFRLY